jgi:hypothetical protein
MDLIRRGHPAVAPAAAPLSPLRPITLCLPLAGATLALSATGGFTGRDLLVAPVSLALLGLLHSGNRFLDRQRLRRSADAWIARGYDSLAGRYGWRIAELTAPRERRLLARSLRAVVAQLSERRLPGAVQINRVGLRPYRNELVALADRLEALDRPVSPSGIITVQRLLTEPGSVLYAPSSFDERPRDTDTGAVLGAILHHLEVRP